MYWNLLDDERLIAAFRAADTPHLIRDFLKDLLTEKELELFARRFKAACMIHDGASYSEVRQFTGLSPNTIAYISKKMADKRGGFQEIIKRMNPHGRRYFE
jgi:uncharacterized protein YerC